MRHGVAHPSEGIELRDFEPFREVQVWVDSHFRITQSGNVWNALQFFHCPFDLLLYIYLRFFPCPPLYLLLLVMVQLGTVHLMLGRDGDLECGSFWEGWGYGRAWDVLCSLIVL